MIPHLFLLGSIQAARSILGGTAGVFLIYRSVVIPLKRLSQLESGDRTAFLAMGILLVALAIVRGLHAFLVLRLVGASRLRSGKSPGGGGRLIRRIGVALAMLDLFDLTLFPVTTACGTYGLLVYRHPDTRDFFEGSFQSGPPEDPRSLRPAPAR